MWKKPEVEHKKEKSTDVAIAEVEKANDARNLGVVRSGAKIRENSRPRDRSPVVGQPELQKIAVLFIGIGKLDYVTSNTEIVITTIIRITTITQIGPEISDRKCRPIKPRFPLQIPIIR